MAKDCKILCFYIRKGGTGKSTVSFNVAVTLGMQGFQVLYIDLDPQCDNGRAYLGLTSAEMNDVTVSHDSVLNLVGVDIESQEANLSVHIEKKDAKSLVYAVEDFPLYSIKGSNSIQDYFGMDKNLIINPGALGEALSELRDMFDYIIIDTNPAETNLEKSAIIASDYVICPCSPSQGDLDGVKGFREKFLPMCKKYNHYVECLGIVVNRIKAGNAQQREFVDIDMLQEAERLNAKLFSYEISDAVLLASLKNESFYMNKPVMDRPMCVTDKYVRKGDANTKKSYLQFKRLTEEIMAEIIKREMEVNG